MFWVSDSVAKAQRRPVVAFNWSRSSASWIVRSPQNSRSDGCNNNGVVKLSYKRGNSKCQVDRRKSTADEKEHDLSAAANAEGNAAGRIDWDMQIFQ